jgi:hypothetical protein
MGQAFWWDLQISPKKIRTPDQIGEGADALRCSGCRFSMISIRQSVLVLIRRTPLPALFFTIFPMVIFLSLPPPGETLSLNKNPLEVLTSRGSVHTAVGRLLRETWSAIPDPGYEASPWPKGCTF